MVAFSSGWAQAEEDTAAAVNRLMGGRARRQIFTL
jgi:hypothetical protein